MLGGSLAWFTRLHRVILIRARFQSHSILFAGAYYNLSQAITGVILGVELAKSFTLYNLVHPHRLSGHLMFCCN
jgi:hypothetical protein